MKGRDQRRYPRVHLFSGVADLNEALGANVIWPNHETSQVLDLSYGGLAARRPGLFPVAVQEKAEMSLKLGVLPPFRISARIVWCSTENVGLQMGPLSADGHKAMADFLDAKLVGAALRPIERALFAKEQNFQYWYQGPGGLHVFVWTGQGGQIERAVVETEERSFAFERGRFPDVREAGQLRALLVLSQLDKERLPVDEFLVALGVS